MAPERGAPRPDAPPGALPQFTPVLLRARHDGWTPQRQRRFIEALANTGCVAEAARSVQMSVEAAYTLRRRPDAHEFRRAWEQALALACDLLEDLAMSRAIEGVEQPVYHFGAVVGTRRVYNDRLLMFLLRNLRPARFAADSVHNAETMSEARLDRLKAEWRKDWEAERQAASRAESQATLKRLDAKLDKMRQRSLAMQSPRTRELLAAYEASIQADRTSGYHPNLEDEDEGAAVDAA